MRRKPNILLIIGMALLSFFVIISIIGPYAAPYDLEYSKKIGYITTDDGKQQLKGSPFPPSKEHVFGTDKWGYDILTLLLFSFYLLSSGLNASLKNKTRRTSHL
ncbi:hypothetical protein [Cytobacillus sp.]|uniref:hypothetical protein n=1 Tax=Cytobacillus sp. TaxID=2675269 RepID=UPI0028BD9E3F|nr:hypothetical protein [Cytobacillus sp.]